MELREAIEVRRSIRAFSSQTPADEQVERLLQAAHLAPVAGGAREKMHLTVVRDVVLLDRMRTFIQGGASMARDPFYGAAMLLVVSGEESLGDAAIFANAGCIMENVQLAAVDVGLGACICWSCGTVLPASPELVAALGIPEGFKPLAGVMVGVPAAQAPARESLPRIATTFVG